MTRLQRLADRSRTTKVRALDNRSLFIKRWAGSDSLLIGITGDGSTYVSSAGLRKLRDDIDRHLRAMRKERK